MEVAPFYGRKALIGQGDIQRGIAGPVKMFVAGCTSEIMSRAECEIMATVPEE